MTVVMRKQDVIKFLEARLAAIEREHYDELVSEDTRSEADARAEARTLAAVYDFLKDCKISHRQSLLRSSRALPAAKQRSQKAGEISFASPKGEDSQMEPASCRN